MMKQSRSLIPPLFIEVLAFTVLLLLLALSGNTKTDYFEIGMQHALNGKPAKAVKWLNKAIEIDPKNADAYYNRALAFQRLGDNETAAIADYSMAIRLRPTDVEAYMNRAVSHMSLEDFGLAISDLHRALSIQPDHGLSLVNLGLVYNMVGEEQAACNSWKTAADLGYDEAATLYAKCE